MTNKRKTPDKDPSIYDVKGQVACWDFRANENWYTLDELKSFLGKIAKKWSFQLEQGSTTGYNHWQGRMSLFKKRRGAELVDLMENMGMKIPNYCFATLNEKHQKGDFFYVMKEDTRLDGPWTSKDHVQYIPRQYRTSGLRPWQQKIIDSGDEFDSRKVDLIIDNKGNNGKSFLAGYAHLNGYGFKIPPVNTPQDLIQAVMNICMAKDTRDPKIIFVDLPRAQNKEKLAGLYNAIEQIKEGYLYDFRYQFKDWWIDSPRVWVFTNTEPDGTWLSEDRWTKWNIIDGELKLV